jgi:hypothetical protein
MRAKLISLLTSVLMVLGGLDGVADAAAQEGRLERAGVPHSFLLAAKAVQDELKLTEEQRKAIKAIAEDRAEKAKGVLADSTLTHREVAAKLTELTKAADEEVRKRLTADQKAKWEKMIGEPFHWPKP